MVILSRFPTENHGRPEQQVLVVRVSDPAAQLVLLEPFRRISQVGPENVKPRSVDTGWEQFHDFPGHDVRGKGGAFGKVGVQAGEKLLNERVGKRKSAVGADGVMPGDLHGDPAFHAFALNDDDFRFERGTEGGGKRVRQSAGKHFQTIAGMERQTGQENLSYLFR